MRSSRSVLGGLAVVGLLVILLAAPVSWAAPAPSTTSMARGPSVTAPAASGGLQASVTWNGDNIASAATMSSAISTNFGSTIDLHYNWTSTALIGSHAGTLYNISDARLEMFYFGFALATRDVLDSNPVAAASGSFDMTWDPGVLQWLMAGTFGITASLLSPNGTVAWSEAFFVHVSAPASVGAIIPILLIIIAIYEIYALAISGRQAALTAPAPASSTPKPSAAAQPSAPPASTDAAPATEPSATAPPDTNATPPKEGS